MLVLEPLPACPPLERTVRSLIRRGLHASASWIMLIVGAASHYRLAGFCFFPVRGTSAERHLWVVDAALEVALARVLPTTCPTWRR